MNLDYFISSLPLLLEGQSAKMTLEGFRAACDSELTGSIAHAVNAILDDCEDSHTFVRAWRDADAQIRNAIAIERTRRRGNQASKAPHLEVDGCDGSIAPAITAAFALNDPLQRERAIAHLRWTILDSLQGVQPLSENVILAFAAKIKINERLLAADAAKGAESFKALTKR